MKRNFVKFIVFSIVSLSIFSCGEKKITLEGLKEEYEGVEFKDCKSYFQALNETTDLFLEELEKIVSEEENNFYDVQAFLYNIYNQAVFFENECPEKFEEYDKKIDSEFAKRFPDKELIPSDVFPPRSVSQEYKKLRLKYKNLDFKNCDEYLNALNETADLYLYELDMAIADIEYVDNVYDVEMFFQKLYELFPQFEEICPDRIEEFNYSFQTKFIERVQKMEPEEDLYPADEEYVDIYEEEEYLGIEGDDEIIE